MSCFDLDTKRLERRNRQIMVVVERRKSHHKAIAARFQITYDNLRQIISRWHRKYGLSQFKTSHLKRRHVH